MNHLLPNLTPLHLKFSTLSSKHLSVVLEFPGGQELGSRGRILGQHLKTGVKAKVWEQHA